MEIISKFAVGSDKGVDDLFDVKKAFIRDTYKEIASSETIENYIKEHLDHRKMINILNDLSNQLIMVFVDDQPAGYCLFKSGSSYSDASKGKKMTEIINFGILSEYNSSEVRISLWNKVKSAIKFTDSIWVNINQNHPQLEFFKDNGFLLVKESASEPFGIASSIYELNISN
ncbi:hypothetical protein [Chryseobacterium sp. SIMBA_038]|uniref:hypothetical protein n=1 Tax=Chryseobacterium sp. SIMBA_038 TaxID=3085780 RepID=UPI0039795133